MEVTVIVAGTWNLEAFRGGRQRGDSITDGWSKVFIKWFEWNLPPNAFN
jgi:hypothetical protein